MNEFLKGRAEKLIYIIGKNSFIGKKLKEAFRTEDIVFTSSNPIKGELELDLNNPYLFDFGCINKKDYILFLAAISSPDYCENHFDVSYKINVEGTRYFIDKCIKKGAKVLFFSSDAVYGEKDNEEDITFSPVGNYGKMKLEVENTFKNEPLFKAFRLSYVFSLDDKFTSYIIECSKNNEVVEIYHPYHRKIIYIEDVVECVFNIVRDWNKWDKQFFDIGGFELLSKITIAENYKEITDPNLLFLVIEPSEEYFAARPKIINISSIDTFNLLGRAPTRLKDAFKLELKNISKI